MTGSTEASALRWRDSDAPGSADQICPRSIDALVRRALGLVGIPLGAGCVWYALFGVNAPVRFASERVAALAAMRKSTLPFAGHIPPIVRFHVADALWGCALGAAFALVWLGAPSGVRRAWFVVGLAFVALEELAQLAHLVPGTFDGFDLLVSAAAYVFAWRLVSPACTRVEGLPHV